LQPRQRAAQRGPGVAADLGAEHTITAAVDLAIAPLTWQFTPLGAVLIVML
jgi:hypothetical protein